MKTLEEILLVICPPHGPLPPEVPANAVLVHSMVAVTLQSVLTAKFMDPDLGFEDAIVIVMVAAASIAKKMDLDDDFVRGSVDLAIQVRNAIDAKVDANNKIKNQAMS